MWRIEVNVLIGRGKYKGKPCPRYRESVEDFKSYEKALAKYERLCQLHSPDWLISLGDISSGLWNTIKSDNRYAHYVWLADTHDIRIHGVNIDACRIAAD